MRFAAPVLLALTLLAPARALADNWELQYTQDGLRVYRDDSGPLPSFKAEGEIDANLFDLMAVLADIPHRTEWMRDLKQSRIVDGDIESKVVMYEQYSLPWPCEDRDSVVESTIHADLEKLEVAVDYHEVVTNKAPVRVGIVRMPAVRGSMHFKYLDKDRSSAQVIIRLDVGGSLPTWAVKKFVKQAPVMTLQGLVKQVRATQGRYAGFVSRHVADARPIAKSPFEVDPRSLGEAPK